jgi:hypothetical protein
MVSIQALSAVSFAGKKAPKYKVTKHDKRDLGSGNPCLVAAATKRMTDAGLFQASSNRSDVSRATGITDNGLLGAIMTHLEKSAPNASESPKAKKPVYA